MVQVTLGEVKTQEVKPYPKIMKSIHSDRIVFFIQKGKGFQLNHVNETYDPNPHYSPSWGEESFADYNEPITLKNI